MPMLAPCPECERLERENAELRAELARRTAPPQSIGRDFEQVAAQIAKEQQIARDYGIALTFE